MVVFTCNNCGESVKKSSVGKHYNAQCRKNPISVSCMDCLKDFGEDYVAHAICITEAEKYSGKSYVPRVSKANGMKKQQAWMDIVRSILESTEHQLSAQTRKIFQRLQNYGNVPRKKVKFQNFVANCIKIPVEQAAPVWSVLEKELENMKQGKQQDAAVSNESKEETKMTEQDKKVPQQNGVKRKQEEKETNGDCEQVKKKKKKKEPPTETIKENGKTEDIVEEAEAFQWSTVLEEIVGKHPEGLTLDKLKKKLLKKYKNKLNLDELSEKQQKKFEKKFSKTLNNCPAVKVEQVVKPC